MRVFYFDLFVQMIQKFCIILSCDWFSFLNIVHKYFARAYQKHWLRSLQLIIASLVNLVGFRPLPNTQVIAYWTQMCILFLQMLQTFKKCHLDYAEISPICDLNYWHVAVFGLFLGDVAPISHKCLSYAKFMQNIPHIFYLYLYVRYLLQFHFLVIKKNMWIF